MIPVAGERVGPYEILGRLGSGGMGLVFSAWDSRLHRDVAIKLLREEFIRGDSHDRFLMEARAASGLNHPNICTIFDIGEQEGNPYLVMELLKGQTLRARISSGALPPQQILCSGMEIADALSAAHGRGIIHRDIKPANIFMVEKPGGGWQSKVLDFGLAKIDLGDGSNDRYQMTGLGATVGTVAYMSPEQARGEALDARSDLFALGIVLYEMATRHVPFDGLTSALIFVKLLGKPPEPIRRLAPGFPSELERVILKLLAKEPRSRFQTAQEVREALGRIELKGRAARKPAWLSKSFLSSAAKPVALSRTEVEAESETEKRRWTEDAVVIHPVRRRLLPRTEWTRGESAGPGRGANAGAEEGAGSFSTLQESSRRSRAPAGRPATFGFALAEQPEDAPEVQEASLTVSDERRGHGLRWLTGASVAALVLASIFLHVGSGPQATKRHSAETLLLARVENHSGDNMFDGVVLEALRLELQQTAGLGVLDHAVSMAAAQSVGVGAGGPLTVADAQRVAKAVGASTFLLGEIARGTGAYSVSAKVYNTASGGVLVQAEETASSRDQIPGAVDRIVAQIRSAMGEQANGATASEGSLGRGASASLEAISAYAGGVAEESAGHPMEAVAALQRAVAIDPKFAQAWMRLAAIYGDERAEVAAGDAATHARDASAGAGERTRMLAEASYDMLATGDYVNALLVLNKAAAAYPLDECIAARRARALRLQGRFQEALDVAQSALARNLFDGEASREAEYALLALDRVDAARQLAGLAEEHGQHHSDLRVLIGSFDGGAVVPDAEPDELRAQAYRAQMMDARGQMASGLAAWRAAAATGQRNPALASSSAYMMAEAALDRALTGDCVLAAALATDTGALPRGQDAIFAAGMANGLCGDVDGVRSAGLALMAQYPQSFAVKSYYLATLSAIDQIRSGDVDAAMTTLEPTKRYKVLSMSTYLSALAHMTGKQWAKAAGDYKDVLKRRGPALLTAAPMYSMAQLGLARAEAAHAEPGSAAAYAAFLQMWKDADRKNPLIVEARKRATNSL